jgi:hypothetical protein
MSFSTLRLTYGITPPKVSTPEARRREIAALQTARINALELDALVLYDLQDESSRTALARPFPFIETIDPRSYAEDYLAGVKHPKIVYQSVGRRDANALRAAFTGLADAGSAVVLVGAPSRLAPAATRLSDAYALRNAEYRELPLGGVVIAERHDARGGEVERVLGKAEQGCTFLISQAVYSVTSTKNFLSDWYYRAAADGRPLLPVLITLSPCGSLKTLEFLNWLGVAVPRWLENELRHSADILQTSVDVCVSIFEELYDFARSKGIALGANVESVSLARPEIEASVELTHRVRQVMVRS